MENDALTPAEEAALKGESAPEATPEAPEIEQSQEQAKPEAATEPKAEDKPADKPKAEAEDPPKVPIHALHEARMQVKALREEIAALKAQQQPKTQEPDVDNDPIAALKVTREELKQIREQERQKSAQQESEQRFVSAYQNAARIYKQQNPDFEAAYKHLIQSRYDELTAVGFSPEEANAAIANEERGIVAKAFQDGVNPGERIFNLSRVRGFKKAEPKPQVTAEDKLTTIERGQQAGRSLTAASGAAEAPLSLKSLVEMSDDEFANLDEAKLRKALGG